MGESSEIDMHSFDERAQLTIEALVPGQSMPRQNAFWFSRDGGKSWSAPVGLGGRTEDTGYGDVLYDPSTSTYCFYTYAGKEEEADLVKYRFRLADE